MIIGFSRPKTWKPFAELIKRYEHTEYSHVYVKVWVQSFNMFVIFESAGLKSRMLPESKWLIHNEVVQEYSIEGTNEQLSDFIGECVNNLGDDYAIFQIIGIILSNLLKLKYNLISTGSDTQICSEYVGRSLLNIYGIEFTKELDLLTPRDIEEALQVCKIASKITT